MRLTPATARRFLSDFRRFLTVSQFHGNGKESCVLHFPDKILSAMWMAKWM